MCAGLQLGEQKLLRHAVSFSVLQTEYPMQTTIIIITLLALAAAVGLALFARWARRENERLADIAADTELFDQERRAWQAKSKEIAIQRAIDLAKRDTKRIDKAEMSATRCRQAEDDDAGGLL
tara:strand:+ start:123 stop:491 length:369 start_codon:yes stop_codon:yes gene_type:complete